MAAGWLTGRRKDVAGSQAPAARRSWSSRLSLPLAAQAFVTVVCLALIGVAVHSAWQERASLLREAQNTNLNLAKALIQHAEDTFALADSMLIGLVDKVEGGAAGSASAAEVERLMKAQVTDRTRISDLFVFGEDGRLLGTSLPNYPRTVDGSARAYFQHHRDNAERGPFLGPPIRATSRDGWVLTVSRRLQHADGRFAGVVAAGIRAEVFTDHFRNFSSTIGPEGTVALFHTGNTTMLSRFPLEDVQIGRSFATNQMFSVLLPRSASGPYRYVSRIDRNEKVAGYHSGRAFPVVVNVASTVEDVLEGWVAVAAARLAAIGSGVALFAWLGTLLARQIRRRYQAEQEFRLLTEMSGDMVTRVDLDGVRHYVSPASMGLLGRKPEELLGTRALTAVHPDDQQTAAEELHALSSGAARDCTVTYRTWHRDGREIWVESTARSTRDQQTGASNGAVVISRDVTARKTLEAQLAALANTDGLTGLANRRRFDEVLGVEFQRAAREETPLSLLLLDVDRFKLFNDRYGHQAGDDCLRAVAAAVKDNVHRPADLAARYGGEELAMVLPNTDEEGARHVAELVREAIEVLALAHEGNGECGGVVTVSVGCATLAPPTEGTAAGAGALVLAADRGLYEAKRCGRNRVCSSTELLASPTPPPLPDEEGRLAAVAAHSHARSAEHSERLHAIARLTANLLGAPMALVSLVGREEQVLAGRYGVDVESTPREVSFCAHTITGDRPMVVPDATADERFQENPLVTGDLGIRFYAGAPLVSPDGGHNLGALCIIDQQPRERLNAAEKALLVDLAALAANELARQRAAGQTGDFSFMQGRTTSLLPSPRATSRPSRSPTFRRSPRGGAGRTRR